MDYTPPPLLSQGISQVSKGFYSNNNRLVKRFGVGRRQAMFDGPD